MIRLFEMFAGYGGASFALKKVGIPFECVGYSEIDKFAIQCYKQNHCEFITTINGYAGWKPSNYGDAKKINPYGIPDFDLLTGGFPCQDVSVAGKRDLNKGRTLLFNEIIRISEVKQPRWILLENVKGLLSKRFEDFYEYTINELNRIGYEVFMVYDEKKKRNIIPIMNSKDYGIPQNRERVWYICFKNYDDIINFELPKKEKLEIFLKDILEDEVDKKYYLSNKAIERILGRGKGKNDELVAKTVTTQNNYKGERQVNIIQIGMVKQTCIKRVNETPKKINQFLKNNKGKLTINKIAKELGFPKTQVEHYFRTDKSRVVPKPEIWKELKRILGFDDTYDKLVTETYEKEITYESTRRVYSDIGCSPCLSSTNANKIIQVNNPEIITGIRKLTPKECFRLMGFLNDEINLVGLSDTQKYKLAGNGWDINLVSKIFKQMLK